MAKSKDNTRNKLKKKYNLSKCWDYVVPMDILGLKGQRLGCISMHSLRSLNAYAISTERYFLAAITLEEIERRMQRSGGVSKNIEISGHAVDSASVRCADLWRRHRKEEEGLHSWLSRMAEEALSKDARRDKCSPNADRVHIFHKGMNMIFSIDPYKVLITVTR